LGSLLKNYEGNMTYDAIYQLMLGNYAKASFTKIREQKTRDKLEIDKRDKEMHMDKHMCYLSSHI
jgi:hypothetical protein